MEVRNTAGEQVDTGSTHIPWNSTIALAYTNYLLSQNVISKVGGGGTGDDRLDQILNAVYRTWPSA